MKKIFVIACLLFLTACTSATQFGPCIGAFDDKDPKLVYTVSGWNVGMAILFFEMVIPPFVVVLNETHCPVGVK